MGKTGNKKHADCGGLLSGIGLFYEVWSAAYRGTACSRLPVLYLYITNKCNSACVSCDIWKIKQESLPELSVDEISSIIPALRRLGTRLVSIGGGEPTTKPGIENCISSFSNAGIAVHINTNGLAVSREKAHALVEAGLSVVYISCDHYTREGYKMIRGVDGLGAATDAVKHFRTLPNPIPVGVNITVSNMNQNVLEEIADHAVKCGAMKIQFTPLHAHLEHRDMDRAELEALFPTDIEHLKITLKRIMRKLKKGGIETNSGFFIEHIENAYRPTRSVPCMAGLLFVTISPFGEVMPCYELPTGANIRNGQLDDILASDTFRAQRCQVGECAVPCCDTGSAEPSIRFYPPYLLTHPLEIMRQYKMHI